MLLLDILIATLVLFPWLTEGVVVDLPGLEPGDLADLGMPLLAAGLVVLAVRCASPAQVRAGIARGVGALRRARATAPRELALAAVVVALLALLWHYFAADNAALNPGFVVWTLTRGSGAVVSVALIGIAMQRLTGEPWRKSFFIRHAVELAHAWMGALARAPSRALWTAVALVGTILFCVAFLRHRAFESSGYDLGIFTNAIFNLTHGNGYISSIKGGMNLFADHQSPLFWALAPLFALLPHPETLLFAQAFGLAAGGPALYWLARRHFEPGHWAPAALPWVYWAYLPLRNANAFDFHPEVFMLPLFLWAFAGFASEQRWGKALGVVAMVAALGAKESAPVVAVGLGIAWALTGRKRWPGLAVAAAGVAVFLFDVKVVPQLFGVDYQYLGLYRRFGGGIEDVVLAPFTQPAYFFSEVLNRERLKFLFWTLAPLGFLPLYNWRAAAAAAPPYLMLFLSDGDRRLQTTFHYGIEPACALFWALPIGLATFGRHFGWTVAARWLLVWTLAAHGQTELARVRNFDRVEHAQWLAAEAMPCVDPQLPAAASNSLIPHLAARAWIGYLDQFHQRAAEDPVRCVVTDLKVDNWPLGRYGTEHQLERLRAAGYREVFRCRDFAVHETGAGACLRCQPNCY